MSAIAVRTRTSRPRYAPALGLLFIAVFVGFLYWAAYSKPYDLWGALLVAPVLFVLTVPIARRIARQEADPRMVRLIMWALVVKLLAALVRYLVAFDVYDGVADATVYVEFGRRLAPLYREGIFGADIGIPLVGTGFIRVLTGLVFTFTGVTTLGAFLVFSWLGFWGLYFFYRAFRLGVPDGDRRRYALLVFFLPSLLFWPSSIGKESWMVFALGISAYGAALVLTRSRGGYLLLLLGLAGTSLVRPHMAILVGGSIPIAFLLRRQSTSGSPLDPIGKVVGTALLAVICVVLLVQTEQYFQVRGQGVQGVDHVLQYTANQTAQGGSEFEAVRVRSPIQLPQALISVLFRPFPFEAHNLQSLVASLEGMVLLGLFALSWDRLRVLPMRVLATPYLTFASVYTVLFVSVFSTFGNFGLLTRQRAQLFPLVLVFLALPAVGRAPAVWRARNHAIRGHR